MNEGSPSPEYYFSSIGEIPDKPELNISESTLKALFETEFSIDSNVRVSYGSNLIRSGTKISLRYFFMFNTISEDIIDKGNSVFFDKQHLSRYREALPRIFDLALGIETVENILKKEKKAELEKELAKTQRKVSTYSKKASDFEKEKVQIVRQAKEYSLINSDLNLADSLTELQDVIKGLSVQNNNMDERAKFEKEAYSIERKIKNLQRFSREYSSYKKGLSSVSDSLKPIDFLIRKDNDLIKTSVFDELLEALKSDLKKIKNAHKSKTPIDNQVNDTLKSLKKELSSVKKKIEILPAESKSFQGEKAKYVFLGEIKTKLNLYSDNKDTPSHELNRKIEELEEKIKLLEVRDTKRKKELTIKLIEEIITDYIDYCSEALGNYGNYQAVFDYKEKALFLRKPKTSFIEKVVGSSSNYMFLHLFFSLCMQEVAFQHKSPYIAPFLMIDQPSRPYYGDEDRKIEVLPESDEFKITKAFDLLNNYITTRNENDGDFQMIVFEHIPPDIFRDMNNIYLVEEFRDGNALIPS